MKNSAENNNTIFYGSVNQFQCNTEDLVTFGEFRQLIKLLKKVEELIDG